MQAIRTADGPSDITYQNFNGFDLNEINVNKNEFWVKLLDYMTNESTKINHTFFRVGDVTDNTPNIKGVLEFITSQINTSQDFTNIINAIKSGSTTPPSDDMFWNQNVNALIKYVLINFDSNYTHEDSEIIIDDDHSYSTNSIKNGDAGKSFFSDADTNPNHHWVESWTNAEGVTYSSVRGNDKKLSALTNDQDIDKTNNTFGIKLLLPRYQRHVEVEDLDRNFWVIGQSLAGISAFLFSSHSPFLYTFQTILGEIYNLWENVLYLWLAFAISMQEERHYTDIHEEVVYLSANDFQTDLKFDNIIDEDLQGTYDISDPTYDSVKEEIIKKIETLKARYSNSSLCIIPVIRLYNYEHNYYAGEWYPGAFIYDRNHPDANNSGWKINAFVINSETPSNIRRGIIGFTNNGQTYDWIEELPYNTALGFTNNALEDVYYLNTNIDARYKAKKTGRTYVASSNDLAYIGVEGSSLTCYSLFRTVCKPRSTHMYTYDSETDTVKFSGINIDIYDVSLVAQGISNQYSLYKTISWYLDSNTIRYNSNSNVSYNPAASTTEQITLNATTLNSWPLKEYSSADFDSLSYITNIVLDSTHGLITDLHGFYMGELISTMTGFFEEHYE